MTLARILGALGAAFAFTACSSLLGVDFDTAHPRADAGTDGPGAAETGSACPSDQAACDGVCVDLASAHDHCGDCATSCGAKVCDLRVCTAACSGGRTACAGSCVTLDTPSHCGSCEKSCPIPPNGSATCGAGAVCGVACNFGFHPCSTGCCGTSDDGSIPPTTAIAVGAGFKHSCAVTKDGAVLCWGLGDSGQLGDGRAMSSRTPVWVQGITAGATSVCAGISHSCAVVGSAVKCWGDGMYGKLGNGSLLGSPTPVTVSQLTDAKAVFCGQDHACALTTGGAVRCWGSDQYGTLGDNNPSTYSGVPVGPIGLASGVTGLSVSDRDSCAIVGAAADVKCWGNNALNQAGGPSGDTVQPGPVMTSGATFVAVGAQTSCAVVSAGAQCWGYNGDGQIVANGSVQYAQAQSVAGLNQVSALAVGASHACALLSMGDVSCWGGDKLGQQGSGTVSKQFNRPPQAVPGMGGPVKLLSAGADHTCALRVDGHVLCWGDNTDGQLGSTNSTGPTAVPTQVQGL